MKIIKQGSGARDKTHILDCYEIQGGCGTGFEATTSEGHRVSDWRDGDYIEWRCPSCGRAISKAAGCRPEPG